MTRTVATVAVALLALAATASDAQARHRVYHPTVGRFMQRDPLGTPNESPLTRNLSSHEFTRRDPAAQYRDGMNLYQYVHSGPSGYVDPMGLWNSDVHHDLTKELATMAGIACAEEVAAGANAPDEHEGSRPGMDGVIDAVKQLLLGVRPGPKIALMAIWHFPVSPDGEVHPDSPEARKIMEEGLEDCDFKRFTEGLHVLQDSWSHQGRPYISGIGHGRGAVWVDKGSGGYWQEERGTLNAALSGNTDRADLWPADVRAAGKATYEALKKFKEKCPCHCPGPDDSRKPTSSGDAADDKKVNDYLDGKFPGPNLPRP
ncbi:MAG: hypothetical protein GXY74_12315 [Phycisphaerae bacterium]|nr:hypothetical protein [Phycisphaerae bacterium]